MSYRYLAFIFLIALPVLAENSRFDSDLKSAERSSRSRAVSRKSSLQVGAIRKSSSRSFSDIADFKASVEQAKTEREKKIKVTFFEPVVPNTRRQQNQRTNHDELDKEIAELDRFFGGSRPKSESPRL